MLSFNDLVDNSNLEWILYILSGSLVTLKYSLLCILLGLCLGIILALFKISSNFLLNCIANTYISIIRGTPLLLQLVFVYYALPQLLNINIDMFYSILIALSVNSSAYVAEIIRSGINSVDKGQFDAAKALSIPYLPMMRDIVLPQAMKNVLPALVNEVVNLVKESAIISIIGELDILRRAQLVSAERYDYFGPLIVAGITYYIIVSILVLFARRLEKHVYKHDVN